jgi:hypothetical protein
MARDTGPWLLILAGIILWLLAVAFLASFAWGHRGKRRMIAATPLRSCEQLGQAERLPRRVAVTGLTVPSPCGIIAAPASGEPCVTYRLVVSSMVVGRNSVYPHPIYQVTGPELARIADGSGAAATVLITERLLAARLSGRGARATHSSHREFLPVDPAQWPAGSLLAGLRRDGLIAVHWFHRRGSEGFWIDERVLRAGAPVVVIGRPSRRDGEIVLDLGRGPVSGVAAGTMAEVQAHFAAKATRTAFWLRRTLLLGAVIVGLSVTGLALA